MPRLILCADDFAFSHGTSRTIVALAQAGKLNATGCMTALADWPGDAAMLRDVPDHVEIGLHLTLTLEAPAIPMPELAPDGRLPPIGVLAAAARRRALPLEAVRRAVAAQFDRFAQAMGRPPAFVDAHQHAHVLPGIRAIVLAETAARAPSAWVRTCTDRPLAIAGRPFRGKALASAYHASGLRRAAAAHGLACNAGFAGHYGFAGDCAAVFPAFLRHPGERHLVMCHPGDGARDHDAIAAARPIEAAALRALPISDMAAACGLSYPT
ncbi:MULTISPECIES: ChbG/HpnK family deacetylase [unclassified Sphingomonas]|uniref:ChbG/HpnK family deacetylase n=1 Tax=unclassified Sphingomonas TaxID=196159 RepID=UPI00226A549D|nr:MULTISPECIES: ChbG/HpnK family deacetylase [unclassified Sphingomonas]